MAEDKLVTDNASRSNVEQLIEAFKIEQSANSITPTRTGELLKKILDLSKTEVDQLESYIDGLKKTVAVPNLLGIIALDDLDSFKDQAIYQAMGSLPCRYIVFSGSYVVGILDVISDNSHHVITQIFTTHYNLVNDKFGSSHIDTLIFTYFRSYSISSPNITTGTWTPWSLLNAPIVQELDESENKVPTNKAVHNIVVNNKLNPDNINYQKLIRHCWVKNWKGGDKKIYVNFAYKGLETHFNGVMLYVCDKDYSNPKQCAYWAGLGTIEPKTGIEILSPIIMPDNLGIVQVEIDWDVIPSGRQLSFDPIYLDIETKIDETLDYVKSISPVFKDTSSFLPLRTFSNALVSNLTYNKVCKFLIDFKIENKGNDDYFILFNVYDEGDSDYSNYIAVYKKGDGGVASGSTLLKALNLGKTLPKGKQYYELSSENIIFKIYVDWEGVRGVNTSALCIGLGDNYIFDYSYICNLDVGPINELLKQQQLTERVEKIENIENAVNSILDTSEAVVWELKDDYDFWSGSYATRNIGQYTKKFDSIVSFNVVRINKIRVNKSSHPIQYKIYKVHDLTATTLRDAPVGKIDPSTHTLLKEGTLSLTNVYQDYLVNLDSLTICSPGDQVVVYLVSDGESIAMAGAGGSNGNPDRTSNLSLLCTGSNPWEDDWGKGSLSEENNTGWFNIALTLIKESVFLTKDNAEKEIKNALSTQLPQLVESITASDLELTIPDIIPAVVGTELNIWDDTVSWSVDRGLHSPLNYMVRWYCQKGLITDRGFRFTPSEEDAGNSYSCTCTIFDLNGRQITSKTFTIKVFSKDALKIPYRCVYFGDSLGAGTAIELIKNFNNPDRFTGTKPSFLGSRSSGSYLFEAVGGYRWADYATQGRVAYRVMVNNVGNVAKGAVYTDGSFNFEVWEINITDGKGNLLLLPHYTKSGVLNMPSGSLVRISGAGDETIPYSGAFEEPANPLWNKSKGGLDIERYRQEFLKLRSDEKIDAVAFQFGINDNSLGSDLQTLKSYIDTLYSAFIKDNPTCKFIIGLTMTSGNTLAGSGANYGATNDWEAFLKNVYKIRLFLIRLMQSGEYPNLRLSVPNLQTDRYYGYDFSERAISQRFQTTEKYHNNFVHPGSSGYGQMGDAHFAAFILALA